MSEFFFPEPLPCGVGMRPSPSESAVGMDAWFGAVSVFMWKPWIVWDAVAFCDDLAEAAFLLQVLEKWC